VEPKILAHARLPEGRTVVITDAVWGHVITRHENMAPYLSHVLQAIRVPDHREPDVRAGRERLFRRGLGPQRWLRVVIEFAPGFDQVVTTFGQVTDPWLVR
jgi:hypothetical protein